MTKQLIDNMRRGGISQPQGRMIMTAARAMEELMFENYKLRCAVQILEGKSVENTALDEEILVCR